MTATNGAKHRTLKGLFNSSVDRFGWAYALSVPTVAAAALMRSQSLFQDPRLALGTWESAGAPECSIVLRLTFLAASATWLAVASLMTATAVGGIAFALITIRRLFALRELWRNGLALLLIVASTAFAGYSCHALGSSQIEGFLSLLVSSTLPGENGNLHTVVMKTRLIGEGAALFLCIAFASIATFSRTITSLELAERFRALRTALYVGSALFVIGVMMSRANFFFVFAHWNVLDDDVASAQSSVVAAGILQAGAAYSTLLVAALIPARALLERKLRSAMSRSEIATWRSSNELNSTWQTEAQQVMAILAPVLAAPVFDALAKI